MGNLILFPQVSTIFGVTVGILLNDGDMRFKNLSSFNYTMLGKQACSVMTNPENLVTILYKAKYFLKCDFLDLVIGHNPNYVWKSSWSSKFTARGGYK